MRCTIPLLLIMVASCGPQVDAPPLTVRPIESRPVLLPDEAREPSLPADPALASALATQVAAAEAGARDFAPREAAARRAIAAARGAAAGSESWTVAQQALTALVAARGAARDASQAVEALRQIPANAAAPARTVIEAAAARIEAIDAAQADTVAALSRELG